MNNGRYFTGSELIGFMREVLGFLKLDSSGWRTVLEERLHSSIFHVLCTSAI